MIGEILKKRKERENEKKLKNGKKREKRKELKLLNWNVGWGLLNRIEQIRMMLEEDDIDIVCLQDTGITEKKHISTLSKKMRGAGMMLLDKSSIPAVASGYNKEELSSLQRDYIERKEGREKKRPPMGLMIWVKSWLFQSTEVVSSGLPSTRHMHVRICMKKRTLNVFNIYLPPKRNEDKKDSNWVKCLDKIWRKARDILDNQEDLLIVGDWNATIDPTLDRLPMRNANRRSRKLEAILKSEMVFDASIQAGKRAHTFEQSVLMGGSTSRIDMCWTSNKIREELSHFQVIGDEELDHKPFTMSWNQALGRQQQKEKVWNGRFKVPRYNRMWEDEWPEEGSNTWADDWKKYKLNVERRCTAEISEEWTRKLTLIRKEDQDAEIRIEEIEEELSNIIHEAAEESFGRKVMKKRKAHKSKWIRARLRQTKRAGLVLKYLKTGGKANQALKIWKDFVQKKWIEQNIVISNKKAATSALRKIQKKIKFQVGAANELEDKENWEKMKLQMEKEGNEGGHFAFKRLSRKQQIYLTVIKNEKGEIIEDDEKKLEMVLENELKSKTGLDPPEWKGENEAPWEVYVDRLKKANNPIWRCTKKKWNRLWKNLAANKAPGFDGKTYEFIRVLNDRIQEVVRKILNVVMETKKVPRRWKIVRVFMLYKEKGSISELKNFRAVALVSVLMKLMDKFLALELKAITERLDWLHDHQFGFRARMGTTEALLVKSEIWEFLKRSDMNFVAAELDLKKAFPSISWKILKIRLIKLGLEDYAEIWEEMNDGMNFEVATNFGITNRKKYSSGVLIGLCSSPILFALYIDPLLRWLQSSKSGFDLPLADGTSVKLIASFFADDGSLLARSRKEMEKMLKKVAMYGYYNALKVHPDKTIILEHLATGKKKKCENSNLDGSMEEYDVKYEIRIKNEWLEGKIIDGMPKMKIMKIRGPDYVFRTLGIFRSLNDRSTAHQNMLEARICHVLYNMMRCGALGQYFMNLAVSAMIFSQFRFAAGLVHFSKKFVNEMEVKVRRMMKNLLRTRTRFRNVVLESKEIMGRRSLREDLDIAIVSNITRAIRSNKVVDKVVRANLWNIAESTNKISPWTKLQQKFKFLERTMIGDVRDVLGKLKLRLSWTNEDGLGSFWFKTKFWIFTSKKKKGEMRSDYPSKANQSRGLIALNRPLYKKLEDLELEDLFVDENGLFNSTRNPMEILDGNGAALRGLIRSHNRDRTMWNKCMESIRLGTTRRINFELLPMKENRRKRRRNIVGKEMIRVAIIPSMKVERVMYGEHKASAVAHSFDDARINDAFRAPTTQTCQAAAAFAILQTLRSTETTERVVFAVNLDSVIVHIDKWNTWHRREKQQHPFGSTLREIEIEMKLKWRAGGGVWFLLVKAEDLCKWDGRYTEQFISTAEDRWLQTVDGEDRLRKMAREARKDEMEDFCMKRDMGIVLHSEDNNRIYEGNTSRIIKREIDKKHWRGMQKISHLEDWIADEAHPLTWRDLKHSKNRIFILRAWQDSLPLGNNLFNWEMEDEMMLGHCLCSVTGNPQVETIHHMFMECKLYRDLRTSSKSIYYKNMVSGEEGLKWRLGFIPRPPHPPVGDHKWRIKQAREARSTALKIWHLRCRLMADEKKEYAAVIEERERRWELELRARRND
jgi:exonuclease III